MMEIFGVLALCGIVAAGVTRFKGINEELSEDWEAYKTKHGKVYDSYDTELLRRSIWETNLHEIEHHNIRYSLGEKTYTLGMNKFGDMTPAEFAAKNGYKQLAEKQNSDRVTFMPPLNTHVPDSVDWRAKGYVTEVKNEGQCGACWAFSALGALEGQWFHKTGKLVSLSAQNLIDCSTAQGNNGCCGGLMDYAFSYMMDNGVETEQDYPYKAEDQTCTYNPDKKYASVTGYVDVESGNETALQTAIATIGPISVAVDASHQSYQLYSGGVYNEPACSSTELDHAALAVGYGTDPTGGDFYIVKDSWGPDWGVKGYILMSRNKNNQCGIATTASYPTVNGC